MKQLDKLGLDSHQRAWKATEAGTPAKMRLHRFKVSMMKAISITVDKDQGIRPGTTLDKMAGLKPVFTQEWRNNRRQ